MPLVTPANTQTNDLTREPSKEVTTAADLSNREKESFYDFLERWAAMRPSNGTTALSTTTTFKTQFLSRRSSIDGPRLSVPVGKLNDNLPVTPMKRKRGQADQMDPARARGATALLSIHLNIGTYDKYVQLGEGLTMKLAIRRAILNYDQCETARIE
ncbi:hypothetical protein CEP53_007781 [Fusarium sp. AF-6]|nr:hypothetical protein CEP53_007781 [Fusarium sp. AF-6]